MIMSFTRTKAALRIKGLKLNQRAVLALLADHENESDGCCFPSMETLAGEAECTKRNIQEIISQLEKKRVISVEKESRRGKFSCNHYRFNFEKYKSEHDEAQTRRGRKPEQKANLRKEIGSMGQGEILPSIQIDSASCLNPEEEATSREWNNISPGVGTIVPKSDEGVFPLIKKNKNINEEMNTKHGKEVSVETRGILQSRLLGEMRTTSPKEEDTNAANELATSFGIIDSAKKEKLAQLSAVVGSDVLLRKAREFLKTKDPSNPKAIERLFFMVASHHYDNCESSTK